MKIRDFFARFKNQANQIEGIPKIYITNGGGYGVLSVEDKINIPMVYRALDIRASAFAKIPIDIYRRNKDGSTEQIYDDISYLLNVRPNEHMTPTQFKKLISYNIDIYGDAFVIIERNANKPIRLTVAEGETSRLWRTNGKLWLECYIDSKRFVIHYDDILHFTETSLSAYNREGHVRGKSKLDVAMTSINNFKYSNKLLETYYQSGNLNSGILQTEQTLSKEIKDVIKDEFNNKYAGVQNSSVLVLDAGIKYTANTLTFKDMCIVELSKLTIEEISRATGVPLHMLSNLDKSSFSNIEQQSLDFYTNTMQALFSMAEEEITYKLYMLQKDIFSRFDLSAGLRADDTTRAKFYKEMVSMGVLSINEVRGKEKLNPIDGGDGHRVSLNYVDLEIAQDYQLKGGEENQGNRTE